ncbi:MAG TPA: DUF4097 family beta strand repeat-containing protein [Bacteroidota bacterium]|nr:DUF4097 family beta strand repeat-containing protein [Bacteroidota bacterium]
MDTPRELTTLALGVSLAALSFSCTNSTEPETAQQFQTESRNSGETPLSGAKVIVIKNLIGPVIIAGEDSAQNIRTFIDEIVTTTGQPASSADIGAVQLVTSLQADSLIFTLSVSSFSQGTNASALLSVGVPPQIPCVVEISDQVNTSDLMAPLTISTLGDVTILRQSGACVVASATGTINAQIDPGDSATCALATGSGNITLLLPSTTSAQVVCTSGKGTIATSGLVFTGIQQTSTSFLGTLGSGAAHVRLATGSGNILVQSF